jgi:hypothetical protein
MFYEYAITVPASTTERSPVKQYLKLAHGIIQEIDIQFPIGCFGLAHARLEHHSFGSLPNNPQGSFATDGYIIEIKSPLEFYKAPYQVKATCWNDDDTYAHTITIRFDVVEAKAYLWLMAVLKGVEKMLKLMGIKV